MKFNTKTVKHKQTMIIFNIFYKQSHKEIESLPQTLIF